MQDEITRAVKNSLDGLRATKRLQPHLELGELIDATERLLNTLQDPNVTVGQLSVIQNEIETIKKEKGWQ